MIAANARRRSILLLLVAALGAIALVWGCSNNEQNPVAPSSQVQLDANNPIIRDAMAVQDAHTRELMSNSEVIGTATTLDDNGNPAILVLVVMDATSTPAKIAPSEIEGYPVVVQYTERIVAMKGGGGGVSHKAIQTPPIQLGTSGGWRYDLANGYCCGGTLGSLVLKNGNQYVLSNYHVLEADIVNGGNSRVAEAGDPVIQPALIDVNCNANSSQNVASLSGIKSLPGSNVDCAIAQVISGMVSSTGAILEVGTISSSTVGASLGQAVKKSGRTTGLTRSSVNGLNANVQIAYENECAGGSAFTKTFNGQILIANNGSRFLAGGDSGSLMVEDQSTNARAVGLLFAGSSSIAVANPIGQVLSFLGATMVGN
jgi:hypothetical protein